MPKVLLLEDEPLDSHFYSIFGEENVDVYESVESLRSSLSRASISWDVAFLDFSLGEKSAYSGLSAFALLHEWSPRTRLVGLTNVDENGRTMFATAAYRWFGMRGLVHKPHATKAHLLDIGRGGSAMPQAWTTKLSTDGWMIDHLFADEPWGRLWQATPRAQGIPESLGRLTGVGANYARRHFVEKAVPMVIQFAEAFKIERSPTEKQQIVLTEFVASNRTFFMAPDLLDVLEIAKPWEQVSRA
ncbi:response regulator transcription factor [Nocardioides terrigena]|uniref:response regulator transcription factor n=1 Tax=Nocardioides terrigena TaxID=424797 RepID=UPI000D30C2DD|nr:response regulator transcription factor [Nocardioides terrigena]